MTALRRGRNGAAEHGRAAAGRYFATRPVIAGALSRWGHIVLPVVLIGLGVLILVEGGAFGL